MGDSSLPQLIPIEHPFFADVSSIFYVFPDRGRLSVIAVMFVVVLFGGIILAHLTRFGRNVYALGGSPTAALLSAFRWGARRSSSTR